MTDSRARAAELAANLAAVHERIRVAENDWDRTPGSVQLLTVTKFHPAADVRALVAAGATSFGENRAQEAAAKSAELAELRTSAGQPLRWHMLGSIQRNKAAAVARWADTVQSVDSIRLAGALDTGVARAITAGERTAPLRVLVQLSLDGDPARGGVDSGGLPALAEAVAAADGLELAGMMCVPPLGVHLRAAYAQILATYERLRDEYPAMTVLSAGMSADLETAVEFGSTCVRVGTAILGPRPITSP